MRQRLGELQAVLAAGDADTIGPVAHGLKGSANYRAHELPDLCDRLGLSAAAGDLRAAAELVVRVAEEFEQVAAALPAGVLVSRGLTTSRPTGTNWHQ